MLVPVQGTALYRSWLNRPMVEIVAMSALLGSYIWAWGSKFPGAYLVGLVIYACIGLSVHLRAREGPADIGIRVDNLGSAARNALLATAAIGLLLVGAGVLFGSLSFPPLATWPRTLGDGIAWGTMQQYGLLCIYYRRFAEILPDENGSPLWATAAVFALFHLPNPFLTVATFVAGMLSCWLYRRTPNLIVLGIMHGVVSFMIVQSLPEHITMGMRVGPGFSRYIPEQ
jgi:membrane protease YdiL (CAAX protease family)